MKAMPLLFVLVATGLGQLCAQPTFDYEAGKYRLIERSLMQYFLIVRSDRFDADHLDQFCHDEAKGADMDALRKVAALIPEEYTWINKNSDAVTDTPFQPGSVYNVELECTDGQTAIIRLIVSGTVEKPMLLTYRHLAIKR